MKGSSDEDKFKHAPNGRLLKKIYDDKITTVPDEEQIGAIGFEGSIHKLMSGDSYVVYRSLEAYERSTHYPCDITTIKSIQ